MTPKEKAEELVRSFMMIKTTKLSDYSKIYLPTAKECALRVVNEILNFMENDDKESDVCYWANSPTLNYWYEVKKEIEKL